MNQSFPMIIQGDNITVVIDNQPHSINKNNISYELIKAAIQANDWDTVKDLICPKKVILNFSKGNIAVQGDKLFWKDNEFHNYLGAKLIQMYQEGFPVEPMILFMENLMENPSKRAVDELYKFLEKGNLPLTSDGYFLAYKKVRKDYRDIHSGTMDNSIGQIVEMERNQVDDDADRTCSTGLHFCSREYLPNFGSDDDPIMILKINPRDVVSIPRDYNSTKGRACRYEVVGRLGVHPDEAFKDPVQDEAYTREQLDAAVKAAVDAAVAAMKSA